MLNVCVRLFFPHLSVVISVECRQNFKERVLRSSAKKKNQDFYLHFLSPRYHYHLNHNHLFDVMRVVLTLLSSRCVIHAT